MILARCSALAAVCLAAAAHAQDMLWIKQFGTEKDDYAGALLADGAGGVFISGLTAGSLGGPFQGGYEDAWLARHDAAGSQLWITQLGTSSDEWGYSLAADGAGGAFIAGMTRGSLGGPNQGSGDAWLARYDYSGAQQWITQLGSSDWEEANALAPDDAGGAFIAGFTYGSFGGESAGDGDAWLARYDALGNQVNQVWIVQRGTADYDDARALASDGSGGAFIAGGTGLYDGEVEDLDAWLARYDASGAQVWITQLGTIHNDYAQALSPDGAGGAFVAGRTFGNLGGPYHGNGDVWLARYDGAGNQVWITELGSVKQDYLSAVAADGAGGVFIAGRT